MVCPPPHVGSINAEDAMLAVVLCCWGRTLCAWAVNQCWWGTKTVYADCVGREKDKLSSLARRHGTGLTTGI